MITGRFFECNVWCVAANQEHVSLGLPEGDQWMPIILNVDEICTVKLAGANEFLGDDKSCITFKNGQQLTIDIPYNEFKGYFQLI